MADVDVCAESFEPFGVVVARTIRPGDGESLVHEDFREAAHADAADADEMQFLDGGKHAFRVLFYRSVIRGRRQTRRLRRGTRAAMACISCTSSFSRSYRPTRIR